MYIIILLMMTLMSATTIERLNSNMSMSGTALMMNHLRRLLEQGTVTEDHFTMVRRALDDADVPSMNNPANGKYEKKIHEIVNTILKELENSYVSFSVEETVTKKEYSDERDETINEAKEKTVQYEDEVKELSTELAEKQKQLDSLTKKATQAKQALLQAKLQEKTAVQGAESLFTKSVKALAKNGVSVRKSSCSEYRQMNEFRNLVEKIDSKYKFTDVYTPLEVNNVCSTKTCQYTEGYHMGKPATCGGFLPKHDFSSIIINDSTSECCTKMKWHENKLSQCYVDTKNYSNDRLDNPVFPLGGNIGKVTLEDCKTACLNPSNIDPKGRPCVAVEWASTSTNPKQLANCALLWGCDYTKPWKGGNAYKLFDQCHPPKEIKKENGFCVTANGSDQNSGVVKAKNSGDWSSERCLQWCNEQKNKTGCEHIVNQGNRGCYLHTKSVSRGNNVQNHLCWIYTQIPKECGKVCSAPDYLNFNGKRQTPIIVHPGVVDTKNCESGFKFNGKSNSVVQYNFNIGGSSRMTFMAWVKLDNFNSDVGLFSYGNYQEQCGFMVQLRVKHGNKDIHVRARSNKAKSFSNYDSNRNIFKNRPVKTWMHVAIVKDAKKILFYLDGKPVGGRNFTDVISKCKNQFQLGRWIEKSLKVVNGSVKDIRVFTAAKDKNYVREAYEKLN